MSNKEILRKIVLILGIANATLGSVLDNNTLLIIGGVVGIIGTMMIL